MKDRVTRLHAAAQQCVCSASPPATPEGQSAVQQSLMRWWSCFSLISKLMGARTFLSVIVETGALWTVQGAPPVSTAPSIKHVEATIVGGSRKNNGASRQRGTPTAPPQLVAVLDEAADAEVSAAQLEALRCAVSEVRYRGSSSGEPEKDCAAQRDYVLSLLLKVCGFLQCHAEALAEAPDKMAATLISMQGLEAASNPTSDMSGAAAAAGDATAAVIERMFPFRDSTQAWRAMLAHANMVCALVYSFLDADSRLSDVCVLGVPPPCYLIDFWAVREGSRVEVCTMAPSESYASVSAEIFRKMDVKWVSYRVLLPGLVMHPDTKQLGLCAVALYDPQYRGKYQEEQPDALPFIPFSATTQIKFLTWSAAEAVGDVVGSSFAVEGALASTRAARRAQRTAKPDHPAGGGATTAVWNVDDDALQHMVDDSGDALHPLRRTTRRMSRLFVSDDAAQVHSAPSMQQTAPGASFDMRISEAVKSAVPKRSTAAPHELFVATLRLCARLAAKLALQAQTVRSAQPSGRRGQPQSHQSQAVSHDTLRRATATSVMGMRVALNVLLTLHAAPSSLQAILRTAFSEIAWCVVEASLALREPSVDAVLLAGYGLCLVEPTYLALPLWYAVAAVCVQDKAGSADWWPLWESCVMGHSILPSMFPTPVWTLLQRVTAAKAAVSAASVTAARGTTAGKDGSVPVRKTVSLRVSKPPANNAYHNTKRTPLLLDTSPSHELRHHRKTAMIVLSPASEFVRDFASVVPLMQPSRSPSESSVVELVPDDSRGLRLERRRQADLNHAPLTGLPHSSLRPKRNRPNASDAFAPEEANAAHSEANILSASNKDAAHVQADATPESAADLVEYYRSERRFWEHHCRNIWAELTACASTWCDDSRTF